MWLKVGELARHTGLTVRTLHHYDEIGLLIPSGRSASGYRQYSRADVARLHGIQALRQLGLALSDIAAALAGEGAAPGAIIDRQIHALNQQIAQAAELRGRLELMRDGLIAGTEPDMSDWLDTLALMTTYGKYFSAAELKRIFHNWSLIEAEWLALMARVRVAMDQQWPVDGMEVQPLANRWMALMLHWMEGDFDLLERWGTMYDQEPSAHGRNHAPPTDMIDYMREVIDLRRGLVGKYLDDSEIQRIGWVPMADWEGLEASTQALMDRSAALDSAPARAACLQWQALMDQLSGHDPALLRKLLAASASEPLLQAGSPLSEPVRNFLRAIAANNA